MKKYFLSSILFYLLFPHLLLFGATPDSIVLTGTLRDFNAEHVDFESHASWENNRYPKDMFNDGKVGGLEEGNVLVDLGADKKPQVNPASTHNFKPKKLDEWFNDVEGVNMSMPYSITLSKNADGLYEFSSDAFFPADGKLFGKEDYHGESYDHNFHMTYELHTRFTYQNGQNFDFRGDDDVWVFIDNKLAIDLGGIHSPESKSLDLDTLGLVEGDSYDLDFFWAERHTTGSNFKITTSVELVTTPLRVLDYHFDECIWDGSASEVKDSSPNNFNAKAKNGAITVNEGQVWRSGKFDGSNYIEVEDGLDDVLGLGNNSFTITAWIKPEDLTNDKTNHRTKNTFIAKASDSKNDNLEIGVNPDGSLHLYLDTKNKDKFANFGSGISVDSWHFVAINYRNGSVTVYIDDNVYKNSTTWSGATEIDNADGSPFTIGASLHGNNYFQGNIDEVKLFDRALSSDEIDNIFNNEKDHHNYDGTNREFVSCLNAFTCDGTLYLSNSNELGVGDSTNNMYFHSINRDINPFSFPSIGELYPKTYNALAYNPKDNYMYAVYGSELLRIGQNAEVESLGMVEGLGDYQSYSGTFDRDGYYYIGDWHNKELIHKIDVVKREVNSTIELSYGFQYWDMSIDKSGDYLEMVNVDSGKFIQVKIADGSIIEVGLDSDKKEVASIYTDIQNRVFIILNGGGFYELDPNTGDRYFISETPELSSLNDGANCPNGSIGFSDYGDAPESYGSSYHGIIQSLKLGTEVDHESQNAYSVNADGDDIGDNYDDEDGLDIGNIPTLVETKSTYTIENISVYNDMGTDAYLIGWIDFDNNGLFDDDEKAYTTVSTGTDGNVRLSWQVTSDIKPSNSYLRLRLSTDLGINATNDSAFGEVEDYKIEIKKANTFDAWDIDENVNHRTIKTKEVNKDFNLTIISLKQNSNEDMDNFYKDIVHVGLFSGGVKIYDYQDVNLSAGSKAVEFKNISKSYKNVQLHIKYIDDFNVTREINATDSFSIRPSTYKISTNYIAPSSKYKAGEDFNITIKALDFKGNVVPNYNESSYKIEYKESNSSCIKGTLSFTQIPFDSGKTWFSAKYSEIGNLDLNVSEIASQEFAIIDQNDGSGDFRFIESNSTNMEFLPFKIDMNWDFKSSGLHNFYSKTPLDVGAQLDVSVSVLNRDNMRVKNFKNGCYAKDVDVNINYNTIGALADNPIFIDLNTSNNITSSMNITPSQIHYKLEKDLFSDGYAFKYLKINFDRDASIVKEPMQLIFTDINTSIAGGEFAQESTPKSVKFLYARANAPTQSIEGKELNATIYYEVYCKNCDKNLFGLDTLEESKNSIYWYILKNLDSSCGINYSSRSLYGATSSVVSQNKIKIDVDKTPHQDKIIYQPFSWLVYNRFNPLVTEHSFKVEFSAKAQNWGGKGELGLTVDQDVSSLGYYKMDW